GGWLHSSRCELTGPVWLRATYSAAARRDARRPSDDPRLHLPRRRSPVGHGGHVRWLGFHRSSVPVPRPGALAARPARAPLGGRAAAPAPGDGRDADVAGPGRRTPAAARVAGAAGTAVRAGRPAAGGHVVRIPPRGRVAALRQGGAALAVRRPDR